MNLWNSNRLRVTVNDARKFGVGPTFGGYYSGDHGQPRRELNWDIAFWRFWLHVKWRPDGKRRNAPPPSLSSLDEYEEGLPK